VLGGKSGDCRKEKKSTTGNGRKKLGREIWGVFGKKNKKSALMTKGRRRPKILKRKSEVESRAANYLRKKLKKKETVVQGLTVTGDPPHARGGD